ncbi:MAG: beta-lactamase domain protein [Solirubrobacterales bacterium]|nr:beta-lactamase domain protein [Solirubrobacterales bacterium]
MSNPEIMSFWNAIFPGQIPEHPILPDPLDGDVIDLEGNELRIIDVGQADTAPSTIVHVPSLDAVISGDVAYNGTHQWLAETDHEKRMRWIASVEQIEELNPKIVVAATSVRKRATTTRQPSWAAPRLTSATSTGRLPRATLPRSWSTR